MNKAVWAAVAIAAFAMPVEVSAQGERVGFGVVAGATVPVGEFGDVAGTGWHAGALATFDPVPGPVGLRFEGLFHKLGGEDFGLEDEFDNFGTSPSVFNFNANATYSLQPNPSGVQPYLIAGLGIYSTKVFEDFDRETDFGVNLGGGIRFELSGFTSFVEARWHNIFTEGNSSNMVPISFGIILR